MGKLRARVVTILNVYGRRMTRKYHISTRSELPFTFRCVGHSSLRASPPSVPFLPDWSARWRSCTTSLSLYYSLDDFIGRSTGLLPAHGTSLDSAVPSLLSPTRFSCTNDHTIRTSASLYHLITISLISSVLGVVARVHMTAHSMFFAPIAGGGGRRLVPGSSPARSIFTPWHPEAHTTASKRQSRAHAQVGSTPEPLSNRKAGLTYRNRKDFLSSSSSSSHSPSPSLLSPPLSPLPSPARSARRPQPPQPPQPPNGLDQGRPRYCQHFWSRYVL